MERIKCTCTTCNCDNTANDTGWCTPCAAGWHRNGPTGPTPPRDEVAELRAALASETAARAEAEARLVTAASLLRQARRFIASASGGVGYGKALMNAIDAALDVWGLSEEAALSAGWAQTGGEGDNDE